MFTFAQTDLESFCDKMHQMCERPLDSYLDLDNVDRSPFYKFKSELVSMTEANRKYFKHMIDSIVGEDD